MSPLFGRITLHTVAVLLFEQRGEGDFRQLERDAIALLLDATEPTVVALGGGSLLDEALRELALSRTYLVVLTAQPHTVAERIGDHSRPLLDGAPRQETIARLLGERAAAYSQAHRHIGTDGRRAPEVADEVLNGWTGWKRRAG